MNLRLNQILKLILICSLLYFTSILIIYTFFETNQTHSSYSSPVFDENNEQISFILIEFEFFENDLLETITSLCWLSPIISVIIVSQKPVYPPIRYPKNCRIKFIDNSFQTNKSLIESRIENHIKSENVVIIPDNIRIDSKNSLYDLILNLKKFNSIERTALIVSIGSESYQVNKTNAIEDCYAIDFDIKRWTLRYSRSHSFDSCDGFRGDNYVVLIRRSDLLELNSPFERPFLESFYIQSKTNKIKLKFFDSTAFRRSGHLFANNQRNRWKHKIWTEERRKSLFNLIGVKKLIDWNGSVEWFGCSKHTSRCFPTVIQEMPEYLYNNRWTPVCCLQHLAETGRHVFKILESYSVRYWLEGGSLLGAARNGQIIPWDYDIDIGVYSQDLQKCPYFPQNDPIVDENGFIWEKALEGDFYRVHFSQTNRLHVDVFPFYSRNGTMTKNTWFEDHIQDREFPQHFLQPLTRIRFIEWNAFAPNNVQEFLEYKFGKNVINSPKYPKPELLEFPIDSL